MPDLAAAQLKQLKPAVEGKTRLALDLFRELRGSAGNLFFSPLSISLALGLTYLGARGNTQKQMAAALHFPDDSASLARADALLQIRLRSVQETGQVQLRVANSLWPQLDHPLLDAFLSRVKEFYQVTLTPVDYRAAAEAARQAINAWVERQTENKIRDLIQPGMLNSLTRLVLVNAIYFKGNWANPFDQKQTEKAPFWITPGNAVDVPMMMQQRSLRYAERDDLQILELPYAGGDLSSVMLLPRTVDGLAVLEKNLTVKNLDQWRASLAEREVKVYLPRFKVTSEFRLDATLQALGMTDAFAEAKADFSGMDGQEHWLYIGAVVHKAFVEVNEQGTEAAAATAVVMRALSMVAPPPVPTFRADHPFLFAIVDNRTRALLFLGRVANPAA